MQAGSTETAVKMLQEAVDQQPRCAAWHANLAVAFKKGAEQLMDTSEQGISDAMIKAQALFAASLQHVNKAVRLQPDLADAHFNRAMLLKIKGDWKPALQSLRKVVRLRPSYFEAWNELGHLQMMMGETAAARDSYLQASSSPEHGSEAYSNFLLALNYDIHDTKEVSTAHRGWEEHYLSSISCFDHWENQRKTERRLKIGYVSPDFHFHSVAFFAGPLIRGHHRELFDVCCYSDSRKNDDMQRQLRASADVWRDTAAMSDADLAKCIRADAIDILIDLSGHTSKNRLRMFAMHPAPVQVSHIGYPNSTGLSAIAWRVTDLVADPDSGSKSYPVVDQDGADSWHGEKLIRLSSGFLRYAPPAVAMRVFDEPAIEQDKRKGIIFGSFNLLAKITDETVEMWANVLKSVPDSALIIKNVAMVDASTRKHLISRFKKFGIGKNRLELISWQLSLEDHFRLYRSVDVALDTYPYNGTTTSCEALFMGVPVVTRIGDVHASRVGASLLTGVGLEDLIAGDGVEYVRICDELVADVEKLHDRKLKAHQGCCEVLCDAEPLLGELEQAYQAIWKQWCEDTE